MITVREVGRYKACEKWPAFYLLSQCGFNTEASKICLTLRAALIAVVFIHIAVALNHAGRCFIVLRLWHLLAFHIRLDLIFQQAVNHLPAHSRYIIRISSFLALPSSIISETSPEHSANMVITIVVAPY